MKKFLCILLSASLFAACQKEQPKIQADRTVIVYLCADNNLSSETLGKIGALMKGMNHVDAARNNLIVYADSRSEMPKLWKITASDRTLLKEYTEQNSASPDNFSAVLSRVAADFPAAGYGLICFSHASGWLPQGALANPLGFAHSSASSWATESKLTRTVFDDNGSETDIDEFAAAIPDFGGKKLDFIIFEACYMASVEVAWSLRNNTRHIVASSAEMLSDGLAGIYPDRLSDLFAPEPDLRGFCESYFDHWNSKSGTFRSATISLINTTGMENLARVVSDIASGDPFWAAAVDLNGVQHFNRNAHHLFFDLGDIIERTASGPQLSAFNDALKGVVEYEASTPHFMSGSGNSFSIHSHSGLTTYITQESFPALNDFYTRTSWYGRLFPNH